ncbi:hypothetical protein PQX77_003561 [Marasmius sp. AFHP31]|nr:hypothetical protein PQX77_003561 [Marasmius sp. AFHP31]
MPMQSTFFPDARDFDISHSSFSHVKGDQHNTHNIQISRMSTGGAATDTGSHAVITQGTTITTVHGNQFNQVIQQQERELTEFDDFRIVKRGDICRDRDVVQLSSKHLPWHRQDCRFCIAKVGGTQGKFTVMSYSGPGGRKAFEKDFRNFSSVVTSGVPQMYAVDIGSIPSILYWNELMPAAVLNVGVLGQIYLQSLCWEWGSTVSELWMDSARGVICYGPCGPDLDVPWLGLEIKDMPSTVDLLQDDVFLQFMANCRSKEADCVFIKGIETTMDAIDVPESFDQPTVISALTQTPIAVTENVWDSDDSGFNIGGDRKVLDNGLTRFRVEGITDFRTIIWLELNVKDTREAWLCQAPGVLSARGIELDADLSVFILIQRKVTLIGWISYKYRRYPQPIYLFVCPPPPPNQLDGETSSLHFWSLHEDGQKPLPPDICEDFGLPTMLEYTDYDNESWSWPTKTYRLIDEYQRLRGFNPSTTDFARHLGYDQHVFQSVEDTNRFDEDNEDQHIKCPKSPPELDRDQSNGYHDPNHSTIQKQRNVEKFGDTLVTSVGEPTSAHVIASGITNEEEERMDCCRYTDQNLHSVNDDIFDVHTVAEPSLQRIPPRLRRSTSNYSLAHTRYPSNTTSSLPDRTASANPYESHCNSLLPSFTEVLLTTNESFRVLDGIMNAASTTAQTDSTAEQSLEMPQHTISPVSSHGVTSSWPHRNAYAGAAVTNSSSYSTPTPTGAFSSPSNIYADGYPMQIPREHISQTFGWSGMSQFRRGAEHHHRTLPINSPVAFPISPYSPAIGYPTHDPQTSGCLGTSQTVAQPRYPVLFDAADTPRSTPMIPNYDGMPMAAHTTTPHPSIHVHRQHTTNAVAPQSYGTFASYHGAGEGSPPPERWQQPSALVVRRQQRRASSRYHPYRRSVDTKLGMGSKSR